MLKSRLTFFITLLSILLQLPILSIAQSAGNSYYIVKLKDKAGNNATFNNASQYLTAKSLIRRQTQGIALDSSDLPLSATYISALKSAGYKIVRRLKWINTVVVECPPAIAANINSFNFVQTTTPLLSYKVSKKQYDVKPNTASIPFGSLLNYGVGSLQVKQMNADTMHSLNYFGQGKTVAILDGGFNNANQHSFLSHLYTNNQILGTYNLATGGSNVYLSANHGTEVLSCMAAYSNGNVIGTAPNASYYLFLTEVVSSEKQIEMYNLAEGLEKADSLGVDVVNISLGYFWFDNVNANYSPADMNGKIAPSSKAATQAARKGMLIVCSAGNEGNNASWGGKVGTPADADSILTVGATSNTNAYASFSSRGPTADGRLKPDLSALGVNVYVADPNNAGNATTNSGTSFASPSLAGLATIIWQAYPQLKVQQLITLLKSSGSLASNPDNFLGFGIPNAKKVIMIQLGIKPNIAGLETKIWPNPIIANQPIYLNVDTSKLGKRCQLVISDPTGRQVYTSNIEPTIDTILKLPGLVSGVYLLRFESNNGEVLTTKLVVQ